MTEPNTSSSPGRAGRRSEFIDFYDATYPVVAGELLALTGSADLAHAIAGVTYARAWQAWPSLRTSEWPAMWVRADAARRMGRPLRAQRLLERGLPPTEQVELDPEDDVLVAGLQRLPVEQRLPLVLHYMAQLPVDTVVEWFGGTVDQVEADLDEAFDALVGILDWPDDPAAGTADAVEGDAYDWTAEALEDSAQRLRVSMPTPAPTLAFRRATVKKVAHRGAPATAAAAAACVGLVVYLSPAPSPAAAAAAFTGPPATSQAPESVDAPPPEPPPAPPVESSTPATSKQRAVSTHRAIATSRVAPSVAAAAGSAAESTIATTTGGTTTLPTTTTTTTSPAGTTTSTTTSTTAPTTTTTSTTLPRLSTSSTTTASESGGTDGGTGYALPGSTSTVDTTTDTTTPATTLPGTTTSATTSSSPTQTSETDDPETDDSETDDPDTDAPETTKATHTTTVTKTLTKTVTATPTTDETDTETDEPETEPIPVVTTTGGTGTAGTRARSVVVGRSVASSALPSEVLVGSTRRYDDGS